MSTGLNTLLLWWKMGESHLGELLFERRGRLTYDAKSSHDSVIDCCFIAKASSTNALRNELLFECSALLGLKRYEFQVVRVVDDLVYRFLHQFQYRSQVAADCKSLWLLQTFGSIA